MSNKTQADASRTHARRALWASMVFYVLIAFEFFYMASPFAAYLYAVYGPGLDWLQASGATGWTIRFFLPHIVEDTRSVLVDAHETVGFLLFTGGLAGFAVGAFQIYRAKLRRTDAVMGGLYRHIRHPQYLALIVASIGMALIWPRYLVLIATVTVVFIYVALAKVEEGICRRQFPGYADYMHSTGMFLPARWTPGFSLPDGAGMPTRVAAWGLLYAVTLSLALLVGLGLRTHAMHSLYSLRTDEGVYVSIAEITEADLDAVAKLARSSSGAEAALAGRSHLLNYVVPAGMYISEIPMELPAGASFGHAVPEDHDPARWKVIFTEAVFDATGLPPGGDVLWYAVNKAPLAEVHVDLSANAVTQTLPPPDQPFYDNRQVPAF